MTSFEIVPRPVNVSALDEMNPAVREQAVTQYLAHARDQLTLAVNLSGPAAVAALKAEIATAAEATKQLGLSKEIQTDAQEMVRRAEYALGKAIRAGQERGEIRQQGQGSRDHELDPHKEKLASPYQFASKTELAGVNGGDGIYAMADDITESEFDAALSDAKDEGNMSRANVIRKIKGVKTEGLTPVERLVKIRELAPRGYTSGQIATEVGVTESYVRDRAREHGIEITADKVLAGTHRVKVDHNHIVSHLVMTLEGLTQGLELVDLGELDDAQMQDWADSLTNSTRALNRFVKQIKEKTQ